MIYKIPKISNCKNSKERGYMFKNKILGESKICSEMEKNAKTYIETSTFATVLFLQWVLNFLCSVCDLTKIITRFSF